MYQIPRLMIAGTHSGVGKTTIAVGVMAAFRQRGMRVQAFKVGPDYIDPTLHHLATGVTSRNLDSWLAGDLLPGIFQESVGGCDLAIVEGVMGLYDGRSPLGDEASSADIARRFQIPIVLVVDGRGASRSVAATVLGFQKMDPSLDIQGVVVNRVSSDRHGSLIRQAVESVTGIPVLGWLTSSAPISRGARHLGLIPAYEMADGSKWVESVGTLMSQVLDLNRLWTTANRAPILPTPTRPVWPDRSPAPLMRLAVAHDAAFNFYYPENLELLQYMGAEIVFFSPLAHEPIPSDIGGLYLGGGFPEQFLDDLSDSDYLAHVHHVIQAGMPTLAECGGYLYLSQSLTTVHGTQPAVGIVPGHGVMMPRLQGLGYRTVTAMGNSFALHIGEGIKGHEFHYGAMQYGVDEPPNPAWQWFRDQTPIRDGVVTASLIAGFPHLYFLSYPLLAKRWVARGIDYRRRHAGLT